MVKIVVYVGENEVLATTKKNEKQFIEKYFLDTGRDINDYDRQVKKDLGICIENNYIVT